MTMKSILLSPFPLRRHRLWEAGSAESSGHHLAVSVGSGHRSVPRSWFPLHRLLLVGSRRAGGRQEGPGAFWIQWELGECGLGPVLAGSPGPVASMGNLGSVDTNSSVKASTQLSSGVVFSRGVGSGFPTHLSRFWKCSFGDTRHI